MALDAAEARFYVQQGSGALSRDLIGLGSPTGDLGGLPPVVAHDVFNGVGGQQRAIVARGHVGKRPVSDLG